MSSPEVCVVLVGPQGERNIGSVARAMMNFSVADLRLVTPEADHLALDARHMAVKAGDILEGATLFQDLSGAVADCQRVFGTTRRYGKYRQDCLKPADAALLACQHPDDTRIALVFGREDSGLSMTELDHCQHFITIPSSPELSSLNLSHAVAICLYEFFCAGTIPGIVVPAKDASASSAEVESMFIHMRRSLQDIEYLDPQNPDHILRSFRRMFGRAVLSRRDVRILRGLWSRIDWVYSELRKTEAG